MPMIRKQRMEIYKEGFLLKSGKINTDFQRRWFKIHGRTIVYSNEKDSKANGVIDLRTATSISTPDERDKCLVVIKTTDRDWKLAADSPAAAEDWVRWIKIASVGGRRSSAPPSPVLDNDCPNAVTSSSIRVRVFPPIDTGSLDVLEMLLIVKQVLREDDISQVIRIPWTSGAPSRGSVETIKLLSPATKYCLILQAQTLYGLGHAGDALLVTTLDTIPAKPEPPTVFDVKQNTLKLRMIRPLSPGRSLLNSYIVRTHNVSAAPFASLPPSSSPSMQSASVFSSESDITEREVKPAFLKVPDASEDVLDVDGLLPSTQYRFEVAASNDFGQSLFSPISAPVTTLDPLPPTPPPTPPPAIEQVVEEEIHQPAQVVDFQEEIQEQQEEEPLNDSVMSANAIALEEFIEEPQQPAAVPEPESQPEEEEEVKQEEVVIAEAASQQQPKEAEQEELAVPVPEQKEIPASPVIIVKRRDISDRDRYMQNGRIALFHALLEGLHPLSSDANRQWQSLCASAKECKQGSDAVHFKTYLQNEGFASLTSKLAAGIPSYADPSYLTSSAIMGATDLMTTIFDELGEPFAITIVDGLNLWLTKLESIVSASFVQSPSPSSLSSFVDPSSLQLQQIAILCDITIQASIRRTNASSLGVEAAAKYRRDMACRLSAPCARALRMARLASATSSASSPSPPIDHNKRISSAPVQITPESEHLNQILSSASPLLLSVSRLLSAALELPPSCLDGSASKPLILETISSTASKPRFEICATQPLVVAGDVISASTLVLETWELLVSALFFSSANHNATAAILRALSECVNSRGGRSFEAMKLASEMTAFADGLQSNLLFGGCCGSCCTANGLHFLEEAATSPPSDYFGLFERVFLSPSSPSPAASLSLSSSSPAPPSTVAPSSPMLSTLPSSPSASSLSLGASSIDALVRSLSAAAAIVNTAAWGSNSKSTASVVDFPTAIRMMDDVLTIFGATLRSGYLTPNMVKIKNGHEALRAVLTTALSIPPPLASSNSLVTHSIFLAIDISSLLGSDVLPRDTFTSLLSQACARYKFDAPKRQRVEKALIKFNASIPFSAKFAGLFDCAPFFQRPCLRSMFVNQNVSDE